jgi:hypothetical protein
VASVALALTALVGGLSRDVPTYIAGALLLGVYFEGSPLHQPEAAGRFLPSYRYLRIPAAIGPTYQPYKIKHTPAIVRSAATRRRWRVGPGNLVDVRAAGTSWSGGADLQR